LSRDFVVGGLSCVIWTLILLATIKYIYFALNADNKGEGGIFALYALLKEKKAKWIVIPALIGCATLLADGFITPAISISSAVEGINNINPEVPIIPIVVGIIIALFSIQQFGTVIIGKAFGPIMLVWFGYLAYLGVINLGKNPEVLAAFNPLEAINFVSNVPGGFAALGAVFLCTTGAEALYSDLGHCGKGNIRISWGVISSVLVLHYLGQAALCTSEGFSLSKGATVFYSMVPENQLIFAVILATSATIIASQALITGVFTLMNEAIKLKLWTNLKVKFPSDHQGQIYIPFINWVLMLGCLLVIWFFGKSEKMESAYGLAITINMVMTSLLLMVLLYLSSSRIRHFYGLVFLFFMAIEFVFLFSNLGKVVHGGWFTLALASSFFALLFFYYKARQLRKNITEYLPMTAVTPLLEAVKKEPGIPFEATNLVFPTRSPSADKLDVTVYHSLFGKKPRKAGITWFLHIEILNEPWGVHYSVNELIDGEAYYINLQYGFKEEHRTEYMMRKIHCKMVEKGELVNESVFESMRNSNIPVDFKFVVINSRISTDNYLTPFQQLCIRIYRFVKSTGLKPAEDFGLDKTNVEVDFIPISVTEAISQEVIEDYEDYSKTKRRR
jgi:KUP system potassium uptake protein